MERDREGILERNRVENAGEEWNGNAGEGLRWNAGKGPSENAGEAMLVIDRGKGTEWE